MKEATRRDGQEAFVLRDLRLGPGLAVTAEVVRGPARGRLHRAELRLTSAVGLPGAPDCAIRGDREGPVLRWFTADRRAFSCRPTLYLHPSGRPVVALDELRLVGPAGLAPPRAAADLIASMEARVPGLAMAGPLLAEIDPGPGVAAAVSRAADEETVHAGAAVSGVSITPDGLRVVLLPGSAPLLPPLPADVLRFELVDRDLARGRAVEASKAALEAFRDEEHRPGAMARIAWCVVASPESFPAADRILDRFLEVDPGLPAALLARASVLAAAGEAAAAADILEALAAGARCLPAERALTLHVAAQLLADAGAHDRAAALLGEALQADADLHAALELMAALPDSVSPLRGPGPATATSHLARTARDAETAVTLHRSLGLRLLGMGDPEPARRHLERALALKPDDIEAADALVKALLRGGHEPRAKALLRAVGRLEELERLSAEVEDLPLVGAEPEPEPPSQHEGAPLAASVPTLADALELAGDPEPGARRRFEAMLAEKAVRTALLAAGEGRDDVPALLLRATLHQREDDPFGAEEALRAALEIDPRAQGAADGLARLYRQRENWSGLVGVLTQQASVAVSRPRWADALFEAARVRHQHMGDHGRALKTVNALLGVLPARSDALALKVELLEAEGSTGEALAFVTKALGMDSLPDRLRLAMLERAARLSAAEGLPDEAIVPVWQEVLELVPEHPAALAALQSHYERTGDAAAELALVERRLEALSEGVAIVRGRMVRSGLRVRRARLILEIAGDREGARADLELALEDWEESSDALDLLANLLRDMGDDAALVAILLKLEALMLPGPLRDSVVNEREALEAAGVVSS